MSKYANVTPEAFGKFTAKEQAEYVAYLQVENTRLAAEATSLSTITFKVATKGGLSVYGLQIAPVTLYKEQWNRLLDGHTGAKPGTPFAKLLKALENPELSTGKGDTRFMGEALKAREAAALARKGKAPAPAEPSTERSVIGTIAAPQIHTPS